MKAHLFCVAAMSAVLVASAAAYDYEVEFVKSTHESVVKTDFIPELGTTFRLDVKLDGEFNQVYGPNFNHQKNCTAIFGCEGPDVEKSRNLFMLELGGNDAQAFVTFESLGRKGTGPWEHCGTLEGNDTLIGSRYDITYDGKRVRWGGFLVNLNGERKEAVKLPISFFGMTRDDGSVKSFACYDMTLYGAAFYKDAKPVAEFIPVVKDGVAGLYDKVAKKFYASVAKPLVAGPKKSEKKGGVGDKLRSSTSTKNFNYAIPVFEDDFSNIKVFAERWNFLGNAQKTIVVKDGAVRIAGNTDDGISWKGELPDEFAAEAEFVLYPEWCGKPADESADQFHWACMWCDYGGFGARSNGLGVYLYTLPPPADQTTKGGYPQIANYKNGEPVTVRFERRMVGKMASYTYYVNGIQLGYYTTPAPTKVVGFDGIARWNPLKINCFDCPFEVRRVTVWQLKSENSANLISNSGFEYDNDGVPPGYCNRSYFAAGDCTPAEYAKYLRSFMVDKTEKHSGKQSLKLSIGHFIRSLEFFSWNAPTEKGKSAVLSVWAKATEPGVKLQMRLSKERKEVELTDEWKRYEITTTDMPSPGIFSPVWFEVPRIYERKGEAAIWMDDIQLEIIDAPEGGFDPAKTYATEYKPKAGDDVNFAMGKPVARPPAERKTVITPAENALNGFAVPEEGLILGHYDFYMNEPKAGFRVWTKDGGFEEVSIDISKMACGTNAVTVKALGKEWKAEVRKLPFKKGATQINQWSRTLVHDGEKVFMSAPCLVGRENGPKGDGTSTQIDILTEAGFKYLNLQNHLNVRDIEGNVKILEYARKKGMKFIIWSGEGELKDVGDIMTWENQPTDWSRQKMFDMLDSEDVITHLVLDEPEYRKAADCQAYMNREKARFPYKPVQMNNCWLGINGRFAGLPTDILMIDYYLTCEGTTVAMVVDKVDVLRSIAPGKPCWYFMDGENSLHSRLPSYKEQIAQCWGAIGAGSSGLSWFVNMPTSECNFKAWSDVNREILDNVDFLCSDEICGGAITTESKDYVRCLTRKFGDEWRLYSANINPHPIDKVGIVLPPEIPATAKVEVMYENRTIPLKFDQKRNVAYFIDSYDGFSRHIYRIVK